MCRERLICIERVSSWMDMMIPTSGLQKMTID